MDLKNVCDGGDIMSYSLAFSQAVKITVYIYIKTKLGNYNYLSTKAISQYLGIPGPTVSKVLSALINAGLIGVKEGARGGMLLNRTPEDITLYDIFEAVENKRPLFKNDNNHLLGDEKADAIIEKIDATLINAEIAMKEELRKTTLGEIINIYLDR